MSGRGPSKALHTINKDGKMTDVGMHYESPMLPRGYHRATTARAMARGLTAKQVEHIYGKTPSLGNPMAPVLKDFK